MRKLAFVVAGRLHTRTGGSVYNCRMAEALERRGWSVHVHELDDSFPFPTQEALEGAAAALARVPSGGITFVDGLAYGAMPEVIAREATRLRLIPIVHLPLAAAVGLSRADVARFQELERSALAYATRVIVTGTRTFELMREHALSHPDVIVVEPGTHRISADTCRAPIDGHPLDTPSSDVRMLCVAAVTAGKGHEILVEAVATLPHRRWRLICAGSLTRDPAAVASVREAIARAGLEDHVVLCGELGDAELDEQYSQATFAVVASLRETYSMAAADAIACGRPVVGTATGAIPALVGPGAGLVVPPGDRDALAAALLRLIDDAEFRARCVRGAMDARKRLRDWDVAARELEAALTLPSGVTNSGRPPGSVA